MITLRRDCNTGHFSRLAAERGASVVAIDQDPTVIDLVWKQAAADGLDILPLVVNLVRPTPAIGWRNQVTGELSYLDNLALADRALGQLRTAMERAGTWDTTTVVISSDHWWRTEYWDIRKSIWSPVDDPYRGEGADHRIPFLTKLAAQKTGSRYEAPCSTALARQFALQIRTL